MKNSIHALCKKASKVTNEELAELQLEAQRQKDYIHPIKMATAMRVRDAGENNLKILRLVRELRDTINKTKK